MPHIPRAPFGEACPANEVNVHARRGVPGAGDISDILACPPGPRLSVLDARRRESAGREGADRLEWDDGRRDVGVADPGRFRPVDADRTLQRIEDF
jgi:hypothetical protein